MLKTYLYIPEKLNVEVEKLVKSERKSKAEILRTALESGINTIKKMKQSGAEVLLHLSDIAKKYNVKGPKDLSTNHDHYLWGLPKKSK